MEKRGRKTGRRRIYGPTKIREGVTFNEMTRNELLHFCHWIMKELAKIKIKE
jgi:hypothetical protein